MDESTKEAIFMALGGAVAFEIRARPLFVGMLNELRAHRREDTLAHKLTQEAVGETGGLVKKLATRLAPVVVLGALLVGCLSTVTASSASMLRTDLERFRELSAPAAGVDSAAWTRAADSLGRHAAELEERAR